MALARFPDALLDAWLLEQFPGRTLEELDGIDFPRLWRARRAQEIDRIEMQLPQFHEGKWEPTPAEWRVIVRHDELLARYAGADA